MALPARPMHAPAGLPLDEATRPELLDVGTANVANRNVRNNERGALEKRLGFEALPAGPTTGRRLFSRDGAPCVIDGTNLHVYSTTDSDWIDAGRVPEVSFRLRDVATPTGSAFFLDTTVCSGYLAVAAQRVIAEQPTVSIVDLATGVAVRPPEDIGSVDAHLMLGSFGSTIVAVTYDYTSDVYAYLLDTADIAAGWSAPVNISTSAAPNVIPSITSLSDRVAVVFAITVSSSRVVVATVDAAGSVASTTIETSSNTPSDLDIDASDVIWVAWAVEGGIDTAYAKALNVSTLADVGTTVAVEDFDVCRNLRVCASTTAQTARVFVQDSSPTLHLDIADLTISAGTVVSTPGVRVYNVSAVSRPWCRDGRYYMNVAPSPDANDASGNQSQALCVVVDWTENDGTFRPIANIEPGLAPGFAMWAQTFDLGGDRWGFVFTRLKSGGGNAYFLGNGTVGLCLVELDFIDRENWRTATIDGPTFIAAGVLSTFDGTRVVESGFLARPQAPTADVSSGSGLTADTGFRYVAIYEDVDAAGNWTVSGISDPSDSTGAFADKTSSVSVPTLSVTSRIPGGIPGTARVAFYRTQDGGEPPYYRVGATAIDPATAAVTFADEIADATLTARAKLYAPSLPGTVGESLDRRAPAGIKFIVPYAGMLVGAKGSAIVYSGQPVYGEATWFSPVFEAQIHGATEITALATLDGALVAFTRDRIYVLGGEIPSDNGATGGLGTARSISTDVGCVSASSVVITSLGIFFRSDRGIELFTRAQTVEWIGEPVQDTLEAYPDVTSAVIDARNSLVRFTLSNGFSSWAVTSWNDEAGQDLGGKDVIFDLALKSWISVDDRPDFEAAQDASYINGSYSWLSSNGVVHVETDEWLDDGEWITASYTLPPWKLALQQDHRIFEMMLLFERRSDAGLLIEVAEDYGAFGAVTADKVWTVDEVTAAIADAPQVSLCPSGTGFATQLRISDTPPDELGTGEGFVWVGVSTDIAPKQGATRGTPRTNPEHRR